nr:hypothetical protein [Desulfobulbaceae bacterium]
MANYGAYKSQQVDANLAKIRALESGINIIHATPDSAKIFARLKSGLEAKGTRHDDFDLIIASCALTRDCILVTKQLADSWIVLDTSNKIPTILEEKDPSA